MIILKKTSHESHSKIKKFKKQNKTLRQKTMSSSDFVYLIGTLQPNQTGNLKTNMFLPAFNFYHHYTLQNPKVCCSYSAASGPKCIERDIIQLERRAFKGQCRTLKKLIFNLGLQGEIQYWQGHCSALQKTSTGSGA